MGRLWQIGLALCRAPAAVCLQRPGTATAGHLRFCSLGIFVLSLCDSRDPGCFPWGTEGWRGCSAIAAALRSCTCLLVITFFSISSSSPQPFPLLLAPRGEGLERVSKIPPERNPEAGEVEEGAVGGEQMLMTNQQAAKLSEPRVGSLHDPAALVAPQFASIFVAPLLVVLPVRRNQFDASLLQSLDAAGRNRSRDRQSRAPAFAAGGLSARRDADFGERGFRKRNFCRRGTFQPNSQRKTLTVDQYHPLRALATLGFTDGGAPFFAGAKLPSEKGLVPSQQTFLIQPSQQGTPGIQPDAFLLPALQPPPAGRGRRKLVGQKAPGRTGLQNPQNAFETSSIRRRRSAPLVSSWPRFRQQRLNQLPLLVASTASAVSS